MNDICYFCDMALLPKFDFHRLYIRNKSSYPNYYTNLTKERQFYKRFCCRASYRGDGGKLKMVVSNIAILHCVKSVQIWSYFWSEYRKIGTRNNSVFGHFSPASFLEKTRLKIQDKFNKQE